MPGFLMRKLAFIQFCVEAVFSQKLLMASLLHNLPATHDQNHIRLTDGAEPVGHDKGSSPLHHSVEGALDPDFRPGID